MEPINIIGPMIPLVAISIPIVAMLLKHQKDMATLIHSKSGQNDELVIRELQRLNQEVAELRERVNHQAIVVDDLGALRQSPPSIPSDVAQRLNG